VDDAQLMQGVQHLQERSHNLDGMYTRTAVAEALLYRGGEPGTAQWSCSCLGDGKLLLSYQH
jgi:hypothetical protein